MNVTSFRLSLPLTALVFVLSAYTIIHDKYHLVDEKIRDIGTTIKTVIIT